MAVGISGAISSARQKDTQYYSRPTVPDYTYTSEYKTRAVYVGPFVRYYKMLGEKMGFYGQLNGGYQRQKQESSSIYSGSNPQNDYSSRMKSTGGFANLTPGFVFFPTEKLGLELTVGNLSYSRMKGKPQFSDSNHSSYDSTSSSFGADFGLQNLAVGASFHLGN